MNTNSPQRRVGQREYLKAIRGVLDCAEAVCMQTLTDDDDLFSGFDVEISDACMGLVRAVGRMRKHGGVDVLDRLSGCDRDEEVQSFRADELDAVMQFVDKWFEEDDEALHQNPATRSVRAREIALREIDYLSTIAMEAQERISEARAAAERESRVSELARRICAPIIEVLHDEQEGDVGGDQG